MSRAPLRWTDDESDSIAWVAGASVALGTTFLVVTIGWLGGVVMAAFCAVMAFIHYRRAFPRVPASRSAFDAKGDSPVGGSAAVNPVRLTDDGTTEVAP